MPLVGDAPAFRQDLLAALTRGRTQQGDVADHRLGPVRVIGVSSPEVAGRVLTDSVTSGKLGLDNPLRLALRDGLLTRSDHESWLRNRRRVAPVHHRQNLETMYRSVQDCTAEMLDRWRHDVAPGTRVLVDVHGVLRHPDHWDRPEEFDPLRFSPENKAGRHRYAHLPFGGGPHLCVGKQFALQEAQLLLAAVLARYDVRQHPGHPVEDRAPITLRPRYGMWVTLHPRHRRAVVTAIPTPRPVLEAVR
jgi:cytochrome P450